MDKTAIEMWNDQNFFTIGEIVPEKVFNERGENAIELFNPLAIITLIETRILFNRPITINNWKWGGPFQYRGFRDVKYYEGKQSYSQHALGNAFDYDVRGYLAKEAREKLIEWKKRGDLIHLTGIEKDVNWVHNDYRISARLDENGLFLFNA